MICPERGEGIIHLTALLHDGGPGRRPLASLCCRLRLLLLRHGTLLSLGLGAGLGLAGASFVSSVSES